MQVSGSVKENRDSLINTLDASIETFAQIRTPDALSCAAFDTLKQARAMIAQALQQERCRAVLSPSAAGAVLAEA